MTVFLLAALSVTLSDPLARHDSGPSPAFAEAEVVANGVVEADVLVDGLAPDVPVSLSGSCYGRWYRLGGEKSGDGDAMEAVCGDTVVPSGARAVFRWQTPAMTFGRQGASEATLRVAQAGVTNALQLRVRVHPVHVPEARQDEFASPAAQPKGPSYEDRELLAEVRRKDPSRATALGDRLAALLAAERLDVVRYRALRHELLTAAVKSDFPRTRLPTERHPVPEHVAADALGVWTADSMRAVTPGVFPTREELASPAVALSLVRNERESAQVCLTAGANRDWRGVTLAVRPPCDAKGRPLAGSVKWERVGYVARTPGYHPNPYGPDPVEKWVPDPLLPAAPMRVRAGSTQGAWLTVFAAPEAAPGVYTGRVDVVADGRALRTVPLRVEVSSVALPKTFSTWNSFSVMDGYTRIQYPDRTREKIRESWDIMLDHRLSPDDISRFRPADVDDLVYARSRGMNLFNVMNIVPEPDDPNTPIVYRAPAEVLFSKTFYPSFRDRVAPYVAELRRRGLGDILYFYGFDEQEREVYPAIAEIRRKLAADFPGIPLMSTSLAYRDMARDPTNPPPDAAACDWFCPLTRDWKATLSSDLQAKGHKVWWYTCCVPDYPFANFVSHEHPPVEARVLLGWMTGLYRADGFLFWLVNRWDPPMRPLDGTDTFLDVDTSISNLRDGDAMLLYPGRERIWPSIRLANVRDGVEDGEILKMLERRDLAQADALRRALVRSRRDFSRAPSEVRAARAEAVRALAPPQRGSSAFVDKLQNM